ncbi:hypothetical protein BDA99DRAFT_561437 [Phascolomyces articulosus]|uniref:Uncharacterized protein n=1 Tax=Phascolomyces articulosus TaxID=60185 RepID=A0AAD5K6A1_9FUNG|nr:hypothetical protein BDA99DRAFT_561437 [Phascolomyces articulosus]
MSQPRSSRELTQWISETRAIIEKSMKTFSNYPDRFKDMITNRKLSQCTPEGRYQFNVLKEGHHEFEHFLRTVKYQVAIEKYNIAAWQHIISWIFFLI